MSSSTAETSTPSCRRREVLTTGVSVSRMWCSAKPLRSGAPLIRDRHRPERSRDCSAPLVLRCARDTPYGLGSRPSARRGVATMADIATAATEASPFIAELEAKNLHPLWDRYQRITPIKPQPPDAPFIWRWREVEPLLQRSVGEVSINDIERRALIMAHPAFGAETTTTSTLLAAFTVL